MQQYGLMAQRATNGSTILSPVTAAVLAGLVGVSPSPAQYSVPNPCLGVVCPAIDDCHEPGLCDPASGACLQILKPDGTPCQDYNTATDNDVCLNGECAGVYNLCFAVDCRPLDDCHRAGTCDPTYGSCSQPVAPDGTRCEDGNTATINDVCHGGVCAGTFNLCFAVDCPPLDQCHVRGACDPETGACSHPPQPNGTPCYDFSSVTVNDICTDGECAGELNFCVGVQCATTDEPCLVNLCEPTTGDCGLEALPDGLLCDDADPLTYDDECVEGECVGTEDRCKNVICETPDQCHVSACNPITGECETSVSDDGIACDDGWPGTEGDSCQNGICEGTTVYEWSGFRPPLVNWPTETVATAGAVVAVKFGLGGDFGLDFLQPGSPGSSALVCGSTALLDGERPTESVGGGLVYDSVNDQYSYHWWTNRVWAGTCRQLVLHFDDGSVMRANVRFRGGADRGSR
jgi:hypothetical protein